MTPPLFLSALSNRARIVMAGVFMAAVLASAAAVLTPGPRPAPETQASLTALEAIRLSKSLQSVLENPTGTDANAVRAGLAGLDTGADTSLPTPSTLPFQQSPALETPRTLTLPGQAPTVLRPSVSRPTGPALPRRRIETFTVTLGQGDTILNTLTRSGVPRGAAYEAVRAMTPVFDPRRLRAGQTITVMVLHTPDIPLAEMRNLALKDPPRTPATWPVSTELMGLRLQTDVDREIVITQNDGEGYVARAVEHELRSRMARVRGTIDSSLFAAAQGLGIPSAITVNFARILAYSVDFSREIRPGDSFEILYTQYLNDAGEPVKAGEIAFASLTTSGKTRDLYRFVPETGGNVDYFDPQGRSVRQFLMRTPVDAARISSRFGRRFHPIKKRWKQHFGVDFAAPRGTRIYAAGDGRITFAGRMRGYGNVVKIKHSNGFETRYAHMHRFAKGIRRGASISQGTVIGYVGSTGWATGPHLHYEVRKRAKPLNPLSVKVPTGRHLSGETLEAFQGHRADVDRTRSATPPLGTTVTASVQTP
ncbi:MAG: M23 family metallopeptidase [Alphaproteobacteria bacterium]